MGRVKSNDPCHCGSGKKYKRCHMNSDSVRPVERLKIQQRRYEQSWGENATCFDTQGCYSWMAEIATRTNPRVAVDIGCGNGLGLLALLKSGNNFDRVVGLDENQFCLASTKVRLENEGYTVELVDRAKAKNVNNLCHRYDYLPILERSNAQITLIQSDILSDPHILDYLKSLGGVDLITAWLIGTHEERKNCIDIDNLNIKTSGGYRLRVQNRIYEYADVTLSSGGLLQVVDRAEVPSTEALKQDFVSAHKDQASVTSLVVGPLDYMEYSESDSVTSVKMVETIGTSGRQPDFQTKAMISVCSKK